MKSILKGILPILMILGGCTVVPRFDKPQVVVSVYILEEFATSIGGDRIDVVNLVPPGIEPHDFELSAQDRIRLQNADILLTIGLGFEHWLAEIGPQLDETLIVKTGEGISADPKDPHIWLDPKLAVEIALRIRDTLIKKDPKNKTIYDANTWRLINDLNALDTLYETTLGKRVRSTFVTSHNAFSYLAKAYGLRQEAIAGANPEMDVSAKRVKEIVDLVNAQSIPVVFTEEFLDPKIAEAIAHDTNASILTLVPIENLSAAQRSEGENYFSLMKKNLNALYLALTEVIV